MSYRDDCDEAEDKHMEEIRKHNKEMFMSQFKDKSADEKVDILVDIVEGLVNSRGR